MTRRSDNHARFERLLYGTGALLCYAAALVLMPSGARSQLQPAPAATLPPDVPPAAIAAVDPVHDAFRPRVPVDGDAPEITPLRPHTALRALRVPAPQRRAGVERVTAIATGPLPSAIVEIDGVPRAVRVGDRLSDALITAIGSSAVELADGRRLTLSPSASAP